MNERALQEHDYGISCAIGALITAMGMMSENMQRAKRGEPIEYVIDDFEKLMINNGLHHNAVIARWRGVI